MLVRTPDAPSSSVVLIGHAIAVATAAVWTVPSAGRSLGSAMNSRHRTTAPQTVGSLLRQPAAYLPVAMSAGALAMIAWFVAVHGVVRQLDEGAQAHLWQLLVAGQFPFIAWIAVRWLPSSTRPALMVLALQAAALILLAIAPLWALGGL